MTTLALGTAQFGVGYGVTNSVGYIPDPELTEIFRTARENNILLLDTAQAYGEAEKRIALHSHEEDKFKVVTKFALFDNAPDENLLFEQSLNLLGTKSLFGVLFHNIDDLLGPNGETCISILRKARETGRITKIGVSVYSLTDLRNAFKKFPDLDIIQLPANIFDLELLNSEVVHNLRENGVEIHVRSIYLQGLILADPGNLKTWQKPIYSSLIKLSEIAREKKVSVMELAISSIKNHPNSSAVVIGVTSNAELTETINIWGKSKSVFSLPSFNVPKDFLDPRTWPSARYSK